MVVAARKHLKIEILDSAGWPTTRLDTLNGDDVVSTMEGELDAVLDPLARATLSAWDGGPLARRLVTRARPYIETAAAPAGQPFVTRRAPDH